MVMRCSEDIRHMVLIAGRRRSGLLFSALLTTSLLGCGADKPANTAGENMGAQQTLVIECGAIIDGESDIARGPHLISHLRTMSSHRLSH